MWKLVSMACLALVVGDSALANGAKKERICRQVTPCSDEEAPTVRSEAAPPPVKPEKVVEKVEEVCVTQCLSERAWALCKTKSWFANAKGHSDAQPGSRYASNRFHDRCGTVCRPKGFIRIGYYSEHTKEWTVFRFGHPED